MNNKIKEWLQSPRDFEQGRLLFEQYGYNKMLMVVFSKTNTQATQNTLAYELAKLIGLQDSYETLARFAQKQSKPAQAELAVESDIDDLFISLATKFDLSVDELFGDRSARKSLSSQEEKAVAMLAPKYAEVPETQKKVIRFREKYPFLKSADCPDELKILVSDMFTAYDNYRAAYDLLSPENPDPENYVLAMEVVENYLNNRAMWAELDYYNEHQTLLGEHPIFEQLKLKAEVKATPDLELSKKLGNARSNVTKNKNKMDAATDPEKRAQSQDLLSYWKNIEGLYLAELEERKNG